ncbi:hypothetical protein IH799_07530 [candidate division KSB1 bacterium]|nr:hypothetical protein [candidate division KSB1 bacterium]
MKVGICCSRALRMEAAMPLYGHEITEQSDPLSARRKFAVALDKGAEGDEACSCVLYRLRFAFAEPAGRPNQRTERWKFQSGRRPRRGRLRSFYFCPTLKSLAILESPGDTITAKIMTTRNMRLVYM